jgi:hypothetical protein
VSVLPPTSPDLLIPATRPYFLWWTDMTVGGLHDKLASDDPTERGYWLGALLREANSRDIWLFTSPERLRADWSYILRHLGKARDRWAWLLDMPGQWPPSVDPDA